jgi:hypothetical protein
MVFFMVLTLNDNRKTRANTGFLRVIDHRMGINAPWRGVRARAASA